MISPRDQDSYLRISDLNRSSFETFEIQLENKLSVYLVKSHVACSVRVLVYHTIKVV